MHDWNHAEERAWKGRRLDVVDETLRDGLQSPSAVDPPLESKLAILHAMASIGVDAMSVGLPAAGPRATSDAIALAKEISTAGLPIRPTGAGRTTEGDVNAIAEVSQRAGILVDVYSFIGSSPIRSVVESWSLSWLLERVKTAGETARRHGLPFCLVLEDTTRTQPDVLGEMFKAALDSGVARVALCDTVGHADPRGAAALVRFARGKLDEIGGKGVKLDWHGHNDRGLALGNAMAAAFAGVDGVHGTAGGLGERTGNVPMEHLVAQLAALGVRHEVPASLVAVYSRTALDAIDSSRRAPPPEEPLVPLSLRVNGDETTLAVRPSRTLLEMLRYDLDLVGSKQGCDEGECGACTVLLDGEPVLACLTLALSCEGHDVTTVESLNGAPAMDPLLDAFDRLGAGQCGFCTSGMLMTAKGLLMREPRPTRDTIRHAISGNLCRCTGYGPIVDAIALAADPSTHHEPAPPLPGDEWSPAPLPPHPTRRK